MPRGHDPALVQAKRNGYVPVRRGQLKLGYVATGTYPFTELVENPATAPLVRGFFMMVAAGASLQQVARLLPPHFHAYVPRDVTPEYIPRYLGALIKDVTYEGYVMAEGRIVAARHEPLVSERLAAKARTTLAAGFRRSARRAGLQHVRERSEAFLEGYWTHAAKRPYGTRVSGQHPRYILEPGPGFCYVEELVERLAKGEPVVDVEAWVQRTAPTPARLFGRNEGRDTWDTRRIQLMLEHPGFMGLTRYRGQVRPARWSALLSEKKLATALERLEAEKKRRRCGPVGSDRRAGAGRACTYP